MDLMQKVELLRQLSELQEQTAPITLSLGCVDSGSVNDKSIVIIDGPPTIWYCLIAFNNLMESEGSTVHIQPGNGGIKIW